LNRRQGKRQSRSGREGEEKNSQPPPGIEVRKQKAKSEVHKHKLVTSQEFRIKHNTKLANKYFEIVANFKYVGRIAAN